MSSNITEKHTVGSAVETEHISDGVPVDDVGEKVNYDRAGAIDAEEVEHQMTVIQAVKAYPAATFWAVVMSSTIVSSGALTHETCAHICMCEGNHISNLGMDDRSWSHTAFS